MRLYLKSATRLDRLWHFLGDLLARPLGRFLVGEHDICDSCLVRTAKGQTMCPKCAEFWQLAKEDLKREREK
jgi:hypothetical protein